MNPAVGQRYAPAYLLLAYLSITTTTTLPLKGLDSTL